MADLDLERLISKTMVVMDRDGQLWMQHRDFDAWRTILPEGNRNWSWEQLVDECGPLSFAVWTPFEKEGE